MNINDYINIAVSQGPNMNKSASNNSQEEYQPPAEGVALLRFVGYIEIGQRREEFKGDVKVRDKVKLIFELHGKNYPVKETAEGPQAQRITITESLSFHEKSNFKKLFLSMRNGDESITHMAQLLGKPFKGRVSHKSFTGSDGKQKTFARLRDDVGYNIGPAVAEDPETGETRALNVPKALSELRLFLWKFADKKMWDSIYIDGQYGDGRSKNIFQNDITQALNFKGSAIDRVLNQGGVQDALQDVDLTPKTEEKKPTHYDPANRFARRSVVVDKPEVPSLDKSQSEDDIEF